MYSSFLILHSLLRWLVLGSLCYAIYTAARGLTQKSPFTTKSNSIRHWTATISHIQLLAGMVLYFQSPIVKAGDPYFKYIHLSLMLIAITFITIGSSKAKRMQTDQEKYKTMLTWFTIAFIIILAAIPWPFSPLAHRPYLRSF